MNPIGIIFLREVSNRLRDWRFWLGALSMPLMVGIILVLPPLLERTKAPEPIQVWVVGSFPLPPQQEHFSFSPALPQPLDSLKAHLGPQEVLLVTPTNPLESSAFQLYTPKSLSPENISLLKEILRELLLRYRQEKLQVSTEVFAQLLAPPQLEVYQISSEGEKRYSADLATAVGIFSGMALFGLLIGIGYQILLSVLEEKSNRLVEYFLLAAKPTQILNGKIASALALGLFQLSIWIMSFAGLAQLLSSSALYASAESVQFWTYAKIQLSDMPWGWVLPYTLAGLLMYILLYAVGGAISDSVTELSGLAQAIQWPLILSAVLLPSLAARQGNPFVSFLSHFPLTSPIYMPTRMLASETPIWERLLSLGILLVSTYALHRAASRLYQHAILRYGQKLSWREVRFLLGL